MCKLALLFLVAAACGGHDAGTEGPEGPEGPAGPAGPSGPQGPPGEVTVLDGGVVQGPPGPQGPAGPAGAAGAAGETGATGPMGSMGPMGIPGAAGAQGAQGNPGATGATGPQGVAGAQGAAGSLSGEAAAVFAGFSTTPVSGVAGGREKLHAQCAAAFAGSHLCHISEYQLASSATIPPAAGAWIDDSGGVGLFAGNTTAVSDLASVDLGRYTSTDGDINCDNWTAATSEGTATTGFLLTSAGAITSTACTTTHVLACCATPFLEKFRGYTTATTTGALGGRAQMHAMCGAQFAGSHLCHTAELYRTQTASAPPVAGAWLDGSGYARNAGETRVTSDIASSHMGRYTGRDDQINCDSWTATVSEGSPTQGEIVTVAGPTSAACTTAHPLACCQ
jgi:Collagen triple helix repeat (20 copies)